MGAGVMSSVKGSSFQEQKLYMQRIKAEIDDGISKEILGLAN